MKRDEITHLASLARVRLTDEEADKYSQELAQIVDYVSTVSDIAADTSTTEPQVGARYNVLRPDEITVAPGKHTADALREMPHTDGQHMLVKKIMKAK